jgi:hypothetical protein
MTRAAFIAAIRALRGPVLIRDPVKPRVIYRIRWRRGKDRIDYQALCWLADSDEDIG